MSKKGSKNKKNSDSQRHLYLDTNILWPFSISLDHPLIQILLNIAEQWNIKIFIPKVCYLEWIQSKKEDIEKDKKKIKDGVDDLKKKYLFNEINLENTSFNRIFRNAKLVLDQNLKKNNINIINTGEIDINRLIKMSIQKKKPFEKKGEKGFRDSVVLFSILNHAKDFNKNCWFITNDEGFRGKNVKKLEKEYGVKLILFKSIPEFKEFIEKIESIIIEKFGEAKLKELTEFLESEKQAIKKFIQEKGKFDLMALNMFLKPSISDYAFLLQSFSSPQGRLTEPNIIELKKIDLLDNKATSLPVETKKELIPIYFDVILKLHVIVEWVFTSFSEEKITLSGIESSYSEPSTSGKITEEEIQEKFPIYGTIRKKEGKYSELILTQVGTPFPPSFSESTFKSPKK